MIIRLRSRDGLERLEVPDTSTLAGLKLAIQEKLGVPLEDMLLSKSPQLLTSKDPSAFTDVLSNDGSLRDLGVHHGDLVYLLYHFERQVAPVVTRHEWEKRPFGAHMDIEAMTRIERQESPHTTFASFDFQASGGRGWAANAFQQYVSSALAFSIKRGGILYGTVDEEGGVFVNAVYEPQQTGTPDRLSLERGTLQEQHADLIAGGLGWQKVCVVVVVVVGWIFTQSTKERDFIMSGEEVCQMAAVQDEMGPHAVTALVAMFPGEDDQPEVHFEVFQVSDQCVKLWKEGWFQPDPAAGDEPTGTSRLRNPAEPKNAAPVIVAGKDQGELDNDYFLTPVAVKDHEGPLQTRFPIENRLVVAQTPAELKAHMRRLAAKPYVERLADFHLLLYLAGQAGFSEGDLSAIAQARPPGSGALLGVSSRCENVPSPPHLPMLPSLPSQAVASKTPLPEGYTILIDALAGM
eukprot:scaffold7.g3425.t1